MEIVGHTPSNPVTNMGKSHGPITLTFGKKCYSVTIPSDNLQISNTKRAFIECIFLPRRLRLCFYQTRLAWSVDQGSNKNHSPAYNFAPTVTKFCVMWEGLSLPHDTKFGNCRCKTVDSRAFPSWSLIHGLRWSGLIKAKPGHCIWDISLIWLIADRYSCQRNSFSAECTCRLHAVLSMTLLRCAVWRKQTSARSSHPIKVGQNPHDNWIT